MKKTEDFALAMKTGTIKQKFNAACALVEGADYYVDPRCGHAGYVSGLRIALRSLRTKADLAVALHELCHLIERHGIDIAQAEAEADLWADDIMHRLYGETYLFAHAVQCALSDHYEGGLNRDALKVFADARGIELDIDQMLADECTPDMLFLLSGGGRIEYLDAPQQEAAACVEPEQDAEQVEEVAVAPPAPPEIEIVEQLRQGEVFEGFYAVSVRFDSAHVRAVDHPPVRGGLYRFAVAVNKPTIVSSNRFLHHAKGVLSEIAHTQDLKTLDDGQWEMYGKMLQKVFDQYCPLIPRPPVTAPVSVPIEGRAGERLSGDDIDELMQQSPLSAASGQITASQMRAHVGHLIDAEIRGLPDGRRVGLWLHHFDDEVLVVQWSSSGADPATIGAMYGDEPWNRWGGKQILGALGIDISEVSIEALEGGEVQRVKIDSSDMLLLIPSVDDDEEGVEEEEEEEEEGWEEANNE